MTGSAVLFPVPPDRAFGYLADPRNRPAWQSSLRAVADVVPGSDGSFTAVGTSWTDVTVVPGVRPLLRTVQSDEPVRWVEEGRFGPTNARLALTFTPCPEGTQVGVEFTVTALGAGRLVTLLSRRAIVADLRRAAGTLAASG
nr:SRPBCC family protein [Nocardioides sp. WS12]